MSLMIGMGVASKAVGIGKKIGGWIKNLATKARANRQLKQGFKQIGQGAAETVNLKTNRQADEQQAQAEKKQWKMFGIIGGSVVGFILLLVAIFRGGKSKR